MRTSPRTPPHQHRALVRAGLPFLQQRLVPLDHRCELPPERPLINIELWFELVCHSFNSASFPLIIDANFPPNTPCHPCEFVSACKSAWYPVSNCFRSCAKCCSIAS